MPAVKTQNACERQKSRSTGFSLVEVVVVVMVILIIAAIAIPNLVHARMRANEAAATSSIKTIQTAEVMYNTTYPEVGYSGSLPNLGTHGSACETVSSTNACIIMDDALTSGLKNGFIFDLVGDGNVPDRSYSITAAPESSVSGRCSIIANQSGDIRFLTPSSGGGGAGSRSQGAGTLSCEM